MKKTIKFITLMCVCILAIFFSPVVAKADGGADITNYNELCDYLAGNPTTEGGFVYYNGNIDPSSDFGWPTESKELDFCKEIYIENDWNIPNNITILQNAKVEMHNGAKVNLSGKWCIQKLSNPTNGLVYANMIIKSGGELVVNRDIGVDDVTVEAGGTISLNTWLVIENTISLVEGAIVKDTSGNYKGRLMLTGGASLNATNATLEAKLAINHGYNSSDENGPSIISGTLTLNNLLVYDGNTLNLAAGSTVTYTGSSIGCYDVPDSPATINILSGASLVYSKHGYINSGLIIHVYNNGSLETRNTINMEEGSCVKLEEGGFFNLNSRIVVNGSIIGKGKIVLNDFSSCVDDEYNRIENTIIFDDLGLHDYHETIVAATQSADGYTLHTCNRCKHAFKDTYTKYQGVEEKKSYTISFDVVGGTMNSGGQLTVKDGEAYGTLPTAGKKGYIFEGWYTKATGGVLVTASSTVAATSDYSLYAHWNKVKKPGKVSKVTLKNVKGKKANLTIKKVSSVDGYQISYSLKSNMKKSSTCTSVSTKATLSKLKKGKTYYVRVKAYRLDSLKNKIYGSSSKVYKVKIKK